MDTEYYTAFEGCRRIATGNLTQVLTAAKELIDTRASAVAAGAAYYLDGLLIFSHQTGRQADFDFRGTLDEVLSRAVPEKVNPGPSTDQKTGKGRPRLGVTSGEVTLLPRHWDWLSRQPGKASGSIRRMVEEAMAREKTDPKKRAEVLGTLLWALAGNLEGFEEAARCLYRQDLDGLFGYSDRWPENLPRFVREWFEDLKAPQEA
jgi:hypothetical protein